VFYCVFSKINEIKISQVHVKTQS